MKPTYHAFDILTGNLRRDVELHIMDDSDNIVMRTNDPREAVAFMGDNDPSGWALRCVTEDGRPVSLLNV